MLLREQLKDFENQELGVEREKLAEISKYIDNPYAVVISGLRRVGKSTLMGQIARKHYKDNYYFVNFENERFLNFESSDFSSLHETLVELFGERKVFFLDEIQNVEGWEHFVRRLLDQKYKLYITGSNASLLSQELGTKLTGRYIPIELYPFSFKEFLKLKNETKNTPLTIIERGKLKFLFDKYLKTGGIPDTIKYPALPIHKTLYDDVIYRDIATRYKIDDPTPLRELAFYLLSNICSSISFNKLKDLLKLGSGNTVRSYIGYLETSWLISTVNVYAYSIKKQQIAPKKVYAIDTGLVKSIAFSFSANSGKYLENAVQIALKRSGEKIYYFKTSKGYEVDFYLPQKKQLIQVTKSFENEDTKQREIRAIVEAAKETKAKNCLILTWDQEERLVVDGISIEIKPVWQWLLTNS